MIIGTILLIIFTVYLHFIFIKALIAYKRAKRAFDDKKRDIMQYIDGVTGGDDYNEDSK